MRWCFPTLCASGHAHDVSTWIKHADDPTRRIALRKAVEHERVACVREIFTRTPRLRHMIPELRNMAAANTNERVQMERLFSAVERAPLCLDLDHESQSR